MCSMMRTEMPVPVYGPLPLQLKDLATVYGVLPDKAILPFQIQRVQLLQKDHHPRRITFAQWFIYKSATDMPFHVASVLFTDTEVNKKDTKMYEANTRLAYDMMSVGKGESAAKVFCGDMNLPPPPKRFYESLHVLNNATEKVAKASMAIADAETLSFKNVSVDTGKIVDAEIISRKCSCHFNGNVHSDECSANYFGNSEGIKVEGALRNFHRSEVLHNLRYTQYLGDGDSKAYKAILESKPYKDVNIEKLECVDPVEKRMGTRLRALKLKLKGKKFEDKKSLGGPNRFNDAKIDKLKQTDFNNALHKKSI
ncbi:uncharacterized protein TNCV_3193471 [Trichonephila clavipes]|nr:uncharacterized protein TNCV_3193471 [Trichonephila clavipes]